MDVNTVCGEKPVMEEPKIGGAGGRACFEDQRGSTKWQVLVGRVINQHAYSETPFLQADALGEIRRQEGFSTVKYKNITL